MVGEREVVKDAVCPRKGGTMRLTGFHLLPSETSTKSVFSLYLTTDFAVSVHGFKVYCEVSTNCFLECRIKATQQRLKQRGTGCTHARDVKMTVYQLTGPI
ncbi:uncharacterized protein LOC123835587 isoform X1 [Mirounga angustirostris]|uniref:uncharacterized protein LOC123835587 isoform X1 n=1 Tax=Mirounga angustirostris TaxID=9716 RepID=UPI00313CFECC